MSEILTLIKGEVCNCQKFKYSSPQNCMEVQYLSKYAKLLPTTAAIVLADGLGDITM